MREVVKSINQNRINYRWFLRIVRVLLAIILVALVLYYVKPRKVAEALMVADLWLLLPIVVLRPLFYFVRGLKIWQILRIGTDTRLPFFRTTAWFFVSCSIGVFTPAGIGDFSLAYFTRRFQIGISQCLAAVLFDKLINVVVMAGIATVGSSIYFDLNPILLFLILLALLSMALGVYLARLKELTCLDCCKKSRSQVLLGLKVVNEFGIKHPFALVSNCFLALAQSLIVALQIWFSLFMVGAYVDFLGVFWLSGISRLANLIPITIGGLGIYEFSMVELLKVLGVAAGSTLAATLVTRSMTWTLSLFVICWLFLRRFRTKKNEIDMIGEAI